jgi:hypothetical protein
MDDIIGSFCSISVFSCFFFYFSVIGWIDVGLSFLDDVVATVGILIDYLSYFFRCSSTESVISEGDEDFFLIDGIIPTDSDETILSIVSVLEFTFVIDRISDEVTVRVIEETSGEGFWIDSHRSCIYKHS